MKNRAEAHRDLPGGLEPPPTAHRPGTGTAPDRARLDRIKSRCPARTRPEAWHDNDAYMSGLVLYAGGFFWEAHEVLEPVWLGCAPNSRERALVGAVIALSNACLKLATARRRAAARLLLDTLGRLEACQGRGAACMGLDVTALVAAVSRFENALARVGPAEPAQPLLATRPALEPAARLHGRLDNVAI